ncbi:MAG: NAD-dependent epimerase/dehydratase family protein [Verrucomicrobia bacterium]|jgi:nucleoside-diphosphate-sugar epimerase|nr:NAD-dependent epimerase/dehydratase family protein [Verrucomicrobiota bacterium]
MDILFIGGTGNISSACARLCLAQGHRVFLLNRGNRKPEDFGIDGAESLVGDINDEASVRAAIGDRKFDSVANFIAFQPEDIERDVRLFGGRCGQYVFISSASVYQKPLRHPVVTESTPLKNPYWEYARRKIACEETLIKAWREEDFPGVIVRPSLTYEHVIPLAIGSWNDWTMIDRMQKGKPVVVHGDGTNLWTMTHSEDFAPGFVGLLGNRLAEGHAFHITSDEILTWDEIWRQAAAAAGCEANIVHVPSDFIASLDDFQVGNLLGDKATSAIFDNSKIKRFVPEFTPRIPWQAGIRRTLDWFRQDESRMKIVDGHNAIHDRILDAWANATGRKD